MLRRKIHKIFTESVRNVSHKQRRVLLQDLDRKPEHDLKQKRNNLKLYVWGLAETGALGIEKSLREHKKMHCKFVQHPSRLSFGERYDILDIVAGYGFSVFIVKSLDDGVSLFGTGINTDSQIGFHKLGGSNHQPMDVLIYPAPIELPAASHDETAPQAVKAAAGRAHTIILTNQGSIFALGNNAYGQCGREVIADEEYFGKQLPNQVSLKSFKDHKIVDLVCGQDHTFFVTDKGRIFSCGWGADGQTGLGHYNNCSTPTLIEGDIKSEKIVKVSSAGDCVLALNDEGEVFGWGNSEYGQIVQDGHQQVNLPRHIKLDGIGKVTDIAASGSSCAIVNDAGDVFVWGYGILGFGPAVEYHLSPKQIPPTIFGRNAFNRNTRVISISAGLTHYAAVTNNCDLYTWGRNKFGCLGLGHENDQFFPFKASVGAKIEKIVCGVDHSIALCKSFSQQ